MQVNPLVLRGNWSFGWALDVHTISSTKRPDGGFDNVRTALAEVFYQYKYQQDSSKLETLAEAVSEFLHTRVILPKIKAIIPIPPSDASRGYQPVVEIAKRVAERTRLPFAPNFLIKVRNTPPLKNLEDTQSRRRQLEGVFRVEDLSLKGTWVLLFDDVFRSGETMHAATEAALTQGRVERVYVVTLTKTRTNR